MRQPRERNPAAPQGVAASVRLAAFAWAGTPLGGRASWPEALSSAAALAMDAGLPTFVWWGPEFSQIHNDAASRLMGPRDAAGFGEPVAQGWPEGWSVLGTVLPRVIGDGRAVVLENVALAGATYTVSCSALRDAGGAPAGVLGVMAQTTARAASAPVAAFGDSGLRALFESMREGFCLMEKTAAPGREADAGAAGAYRIVVANPAILRQSGFTDAVGRTVDEILGPRARELAAIYDAVLATGHSQRVDEHLADRGLWLDTYVFRVGEPGAWRIGALFTDITARKAAEARQSRLLGEMQHRVRSILATVRAILRGSEQNADSLESFAAHLEGRIASLARTQALLARVPDARVDLENLVRDELRAQAADEARVTLDGPDVALPARAAEVVTMAIHELATNATKYGALAQRDARIVVDWRLQEQDGEPWVKLVWREQGVRVAAAAPRRRGFGTELIVDRAPYELAGRGELKMAAGGIRSQIEFPLRDRA